MILVDFDSIIHCVENLYNIFTAYHFSQNIVQLLSSLIVQDQRCMDWLHKQPPKSVIYVSFGSIASFGKQELVETAWAWLVAGNPFLVKSNFPMNL